MAARELNVYRSYPRLNFLGEWKQSLLLIDSIGLGTPSLGKFNLSAAVPGKEVEFGKAQVWWYILTYISRFDPGSGQMDLGKLPRDI